MSTCAWSGCFPVMLTPFTAAGEIDAPAVDMLVEWYLEHGATGLFACCQSSEIGQLGWDERLGLARQVVARVAGRVPVVATGTIGVGDLAGEAACLRQMAATGVDAAVVITGQVVPREADDAQAEALLLRLAELAGDAPLGLYECPRPYKRLLTAGSLGRLAASGRWLYHKDTACEVAQTSAKIRACAGTALRVFDAHAAHIAASCAAGGAGASPILANLVPDLVAQLCREGDAELQRELAALGALVEIGYPRATKEALVLAGLPMTAACRVRSTACQAGHAQRLADEAARLRALFQVAV